MRYLLEGILKVFLGFYGVISYHNLYNSHEVYPVLFRMLYGCGLRISETLNLKIKNVDTGSGKIVIDVAKNDKQRIVIMSDSLKTICHSYKNKYLLDHDDTTTFFQHKYVRLYASHRNMSVTLVFFLCLSSWCTLL